MRWLAVGVACVAAALAILLTVGANGAIERSAACPQPVRPPSVKMIQRPRWLTDVLITEYFPAPESWFNGRLVRAPGLAGVHRIDWLYSARGLAMQGEGIGADGRLYHFAGPYSLTWRNADGALTYPCAGNPGVWTNAAPAWIGPTPINRDDRVTYPLPNGAWSDGPPTRVAAASASARFAPGASLSLSYWHDAAVDPRMIPHGSSLFVPAYCDTPSRGWFIAADTGGAILGRHIDIYRSPPRIPWDDGVLRNQRIFVDPPGYARPVDVRC
jgi:hypothetical protein